MNPPKTPFGRRFLGSMLSALVGWFCLTLYFCSFSVFKPSAWITSLAFSGFAFLFVFGTWFLLLLPLYFLVPQTSLLWRWPICTFCGALAGGLIMLALSGFRFSVEIWGLALLAALTGGATCLFGALTAPRYHDPRHPTNLHR